MSRSPYSPFSASDFDDDAWSVVEDKKKAKSAQRRERKAAEAEAAKLATVGSEIDPNDIEAIRRAANASFYGVPQQKAKMQSKRREADGDFEYDTWTGGNGAPNPKAKKSKKPKTVLPQYNTADEIEEALFTLIDNVPPAQKGQPVTIASLGDKLQILTKQSWNKRYKPDFGTLKKFLETRPSKRFNVDGDYVNIQTVPSSSSSASKSKPTKPKAATKSDSNQSKNGNATKKSQQQNDDSQDEDDDDEDDDEDDDSSDDDSPAPSKVRSSSSKTGQQSSSGSFSTILSILMLLVAGGLAYAYSQNLLLKQ